MRFKLEIDLDQDADLRTPKDVARLLMRLARQMLKHSVFASCFCSGSYHNAMYWEVTAKPKIILNWGGPRA